MNVLDYVEYKNLVEKIAEFICEVSEAYGIDESKTFTLIKLHAEILRVKNDLARIS